MQKSTWLKPHCRSHSSCQAELTRSTQRCTGKCGPRDLPHSSFSMGIENSITTPWTSASSPSNNHATSLESEWQEPGWTFTSMDNGYFCAKKRADSKGLLPSWVHATCQYAEGIIAEWKDVWACCWHNCYLIQRSEFYITPCILTS